MNYKMIARRESDNASAYMYWQGGDRFSVRYSFEAFCINEQTDFDSYEDAKAEFNRLADVVRGNNYHHWGDDAPATFGAR